MLNARTEYLNSLIGPRNMYQSKGTQDSDYGILKGAFKLSTPSRFMPTKNDSYKLRSISKRKLLQLIRKKKNLFFSKYRQCSCRTFWSSQQKWYRLIFDQEIVDFVLFSDILLIRNRP